MSARIVLIDDALELHPIVQSLVAQEGHELRGASDGATGVKLATEWVPDLILLDMDLPDSNGLDVCEVLQIRAETSLIPVIFLSAHATEADRVQGLNQGACDYVAKPFLPMELMARIRAVLRHRKLLGMDQRTALRDALTGLWNRGYLEDRLSAEVAAAKRHGKPLSALMVDIDHFKSINDRYGHAMGDVAIRAVATIVTASCRIEDIACRYGGEEFVILCPSTARTDAMGLAERLRRSVSAHSIPGNSCSISLTVSIGVSDIAPSSSVLLKSADDALYLAKASGRNKVCVVDNLQF